MLSESCILELLDDLQHDLGKYVQLPLIMLPKDAEASVVRSAAYSALFETRRSSKGIESAEVLWTDFRAEVGNQLLGCQCWLPLVSALEAVFAWGPRIEDETQVLDRVKMTEDFCAVNSAIRALQDELDGE